MYVSNLILHEIFFVPESPANPNAQLPSDFTYNSLTASMPPKPFSASVKMQRRLNEIVLLFQTTADAQVQGGAAARWAACLRLCPL